jgi:hypothetical protein
MPDPEQLYTLTVITVKKQKVTACSKNRINMGTVHSNFPDIIHPNAGIGGQFFFSNQGIKIPCTLNDLVT